MSSPITAAMQQICEEKNISFESVLDTVQIALAAAFRKDFGEKDQNVFVKFDPETASIKAFDVKTVVEDMELPTEEELEAMRVAEMARPVYHRGAAGTTAATVESEDVKPKFNPKTMIMLTAAKEIKKDAVLGELIERELEVPGAFGRMAAQTAKQVIMQKLREAERNMVFNEYKDKEKEILVVTVQRREGRVVLVDLGRATGIMLPEDQIEREQYMPGERIKVMLKEVSMTPKGPELLVSRTSPMLVDKLFHLEIPEVATGVVELKAIAREGGSRSKVAVKSNEENIDPIGSCIGQRGSRIQTIIAELGGEKIDVILWSDDVKEFIMHAVAPAKATAVELNDAEKTALVVVPEDQLSLAIGKGGQNVRLAAKLTGWKINVRGEAMPASEVAAAVEEKKE
ncbi:MAG: transcription termination factor NusA [bacterium]